VNLNLSGSDGLDLLIVILAVLVMPAMSARAGVRLARASAQSLVPRYWSTILRGWSAAAVLLGVWWWSGRSLHALGLDIPVGWRGQWGFLLDALLLTFFAAQQIRLSRLPQAEVETLVARIAALKVAPRTPSELAVFLLLSITAGIWEELLYRGFLIWYLSPRAGLVAALFLSAAIFGLGHAYQGWRGVLNTTLIGLAFAGFYALSQSLWWLMLAHALIDMSGGLTAWRISARVRAGAAVKVN
jgi:membrane protease YdiL (CAAX protease family)